MKYLVVVSLFLAGCGSAQKGNCQTYRNYTETVEICRWWNRVDVNIKR